jgi:filamentous hemagglutinin
MERAKEDGMALVLTLIMLALLTIMGVSLTFLAQTETLSTMNYRLTSQARDGAEAGINTAANYLLYTYTRPGGAGDPLSNYTLTAAPVTYNGNPVVLSGNSSVSSNYPVAADQTAFNTNGVGYCNSCGLTASTATVNYQTYATLQSMQQVNLYGGGTATIQTWLITSDGTVTNGIRSATVELSAILEQQGGGPVPAFQYGAFASSNGCDVLALSGNATVNSYNSANYSSSKGAVSATNGGLSNSGGNIATNGNLTSSGNATIYGTLSTPRALDPGGTKSCSTNNVVAWTTSGNATVTGGLIELAAPVVPPVPAAPSPAPSTTSMGLSSSSSCSNFPAGSCTYSSSTGFTLLPCPSTGCTATSVGMYGNVNLSGGNTLNLSAGTYYMNSINVSGNSSVVVTSGPVIINVAGSGQGSPINMSGGTVLNATMISSNFQIQYAGTGSVTLSGGASSAGIVDTPNAPLNLSGNATWYGALIGSTITDSGGATICYDRALSSGGSTAYSTVGNYMLESFTWKKF